MQVSVEAADGLERRMRVQIPADRIEKMISDRLRSVGRTAKIKGFRPGKIPERVIRQRYGGQVRQEVLQEMLQSSYSEAIAEQNLQPAGGPKIEAETLDQGQDLAYTAVFEVYPEFELQGLGALELEAHQTEISAADVDAMIENLREQRASWEPVERPAADGDRVLVDFEGSLKGEPFEGGSGQDVPVLLGSGAMLEEFEKNLIGLAAGDSKEFKLKFPKDYHQDQLAGKKVIFSVTAKEVAERILPAVDAEFIKTMGIETGSSDDFRQDVLENMERQIGPKRRADLKKQALESLLDSNPITLPSVLVDQETMSLQQDALRRFGITDEKDAPALDTFREAAVRRVRLSLIMNAILNENELQLDKQRVGEKVKELCEPYDQPEEMRKIYYQNQQLIGQVENMVLEEQVLDWLISRATLQEKNISFMELMDL